MIKWQSTNILKGEKVDLIPLKVEHRDSLLTATTDGKLWELWYTSVPSASTIDKYIETALIQYQNKQSMPYAVFHHESNSIIGTTRYCNIDNANRRVEIGYTWYAKTYQKTGVNTECKYLLLQNAFENFEAIAVEFRTHWFNHNSRSAILRLGAKQDGIIRNHQFDKNGNLRDTVVFSIISSEWPTVKSALEYKMKKY